MHSLENVILIRSTRPKMEISLRISGMKKLRIYSVVPMCIRLMGFCGMQPSRFVLVFIDSGQAV